MKEHFKCRPAILIIDADPATKKGTKFGEVFVVTPTQMTRQDRKQLL